ncbi:MAG: hypothetical protein ACLFRK_02040 [Candidatus Nanohaloarchaea archaeon]
MVDTGNVLGEAEGVLRQIRGIVNDLAEEGRKVDSRQESIEDFLSGKDPEDLSRQELDRLEEMLGKEGLEIEDEAERIEQAIRDQQQLIGMLSEYEQGIGSEEKSTFQKLEKVKQEIRGLNQKMSHQTVDQAIQDLERAVAEMSVEADQILGAAKLIGEMERAEGSDLQLESHLEEEVGRFNSELDVMEKFVNYIGGEEESRYASKIEELRQQVNEEVRTENRQVGQEIQEEEELVEQIKTEAQRYREELQEAYEEARSMEQRISGAQGFQSEENELGKVISQIEQENEKAEEAVQTIQQDESFLSRLMNR